MSTKLKENSLGLISSIAMGVAGTAPAYSIEAALAAMVAMLGVFAPAIILLSGIVMTGVAFAFIHLSKVMPSAGSSFTWVSHVFGKRVGFFVGWSMLVACCIFMVSATIPASNAILLLIDKSLINDTTLISLISFLLFTCISFIILKGINLSAKVQTTITIVEAVILGAIAIAAFCIFPQNPIETFSFSWFNIFSLSATQVLSGMVLGIFFFYGWDVVVSLSEETKDKEKTPAKSLFYTMLILNIIFIIFIVIALMGLTGEEMEHYNTNILYVIASKLYGHYFAILAIVTVLLSTIGTIETQIIQFSRSLFAQARDGVLHNMFAELHTKWQTPHKAIYTIWIIGSAFILLSGNVSSINELLSIAISSMSFQISLYLGATALASAWYFRKSLISEMRSKSTNKIKSLLNYFTKVVFPLASGIFLFVVLGYSLIYEFDFITVAISLGSLAVGVVPYWFYVRKGKVVY